LYSPTRETTAWIDTLQTAPVGYRLLEKKNRLRDASRPYRQVAHVIQLPNASPMAGSGLSKAGWHHVALSMTGSATRMASLYVDGRGLHSSTCQLNLSRLGRTSACHPV